MIIKSMSRKPVSFAQLYDYMHSSVVVGSPVQWNLGRCRNRQQILDQFYDNADLLKRRAKGNALYHEILSLKTQPGVSIERQVRALHDLSAKYLAARGHGLLGYGRVHVEKGHIHIHLMLSANELNRVKRHRLSKTEFSQIQKQCEQYLRQTYPDLEQPQVYDKTKTAKKSRSRKPKAKSMREQRKADLEAYYRSVEDELNKSQEPSNEL